MNTEFDSIALTRAKYYSKGAPVQFAYVELLKAKQTGEIAVTLTFKNLATKALNALTVQYICNDTQGNAIAQGTYEYNNLNVQEGELFGADDAVFISNTPIGNIEVVLLNANYMGKVFPLNNCPTVALPALKKLGDNTVNIVNDIVKTNNVNYMPCNVKDGWQCTCGAFNYNIGKGKTTCLECNVTKENLINAIRSAVKIINEQKQSVSNENIVNTPAETPIQEQNNYPTEDATVIYNISENEPINYAPQQNYDYEVDNALYQQELPPIDHSNLDISDEIELHSMDDLEMKISDGEGNYSYENNYDPINNPHVYEGYNATINNQDAREYVRQERKKREPFLMANETADKIIKYAPIVTGLAVILFFILLIGIDIIVN